MDLQLSSLVTSGKNNKISSIRVGFLFALLIVMLNWSYVIYKKSEFVPLPENAVTLVIGLATAKVVQRFGEEKSKTETTVDTTPKV